MTLNLWIKLLLQDKLGEMGVEGKSNLTLAMTCLLVSGLGRQVCTGLLLIYGLIIGFIETMKTFLAR